MSKIRAIFITQFIGINAFFELMHGENVHIVCCIVCPGHLSRVP